MERENEMIVISHRLFFFSVKIKERISDEIRSCGGVREIRTPAPVTRSNDLANRPLQPLEYHSKKAYCDIIAYFDLNGKA